MRTLVISDLHLGGHGDRARLHRPEVRAALLQQLSGVGRLVLLGDTVELRHASARDALAGASRIATELAAALPSGAEVVLVPGNHDHALGAGWALRRSAAAERPAPLALETAIDAVPGEPLAVLMEAFGVSGARVRAAYPGVWLRADVYAHHGHYLDRHTTVPFFERVGAGLMGRLTHTETGAAATPDDYERVLAPLYGWMYPLAQAGAAAVDGSEGPSVRAWRVLRFGSGPRRWLLAAAASAGVAVLNRAGLGPLSTRALRGSLDGAELPAFAAVLDALGVRSAWALFGHTHRAGPLPGDEASGWMAPNGVRMMNTGSWVHDDLFIDPSAQDGRMSPYRPGFGVLVDDDGPPRLTNFLDPVTKR